MLITLTTKSFASPLSTSKLRAWLRTPSTENSLIGEIGRQATSRFEQYTQLSLMGHTYTVYLDLAELDQNLVTASGQIIHLPHRPVSSIASISYFDQTDTETTIDAADYSFIAGDSQVKILNTFQSSGAIRDQRAIKFVYTVGYSDNSVIPDDILESLQMYCAYLYEHRGDEDNEPQPEILEMWQSYLVVRFGGV